jgi:hypothetical protein
VRAPVSVTISSRGSGRAQPLDATAAVLDGALLGASETAYVSRAALAVAALVAAAQQATRQCRATLFFVWHAPAGLAACACLLWRA